MTSANQAATGTGDPGQTVAASAPPSVAHGVSILAFSNVAVVACSFLSAPLLARALGPDGRGLLAAVLVPLSVATVLLLSAMPEYASREVARGRSPSEVFTSLLPVLTVAMGAAAAAIILASDAIADGRDVVHTYLIVGAILMPVGGLASLIAGIASGRQRWGVMALVHALPPCAASLTVALLYVLDELTVASAATATLACGLLGVLPGVALRGQLWRGARFVPALAAGAVSFGARAWPGMVAILVNGRLDQLLMIRLTSPRQLGLYAVAVTIASAPGLVIGALSNVIFPRLAAGQADLAPRACRVSLMATALTGVAVALCSYPLLRFVFGREFLDAVPMVAILLVASIPTSGSLVLASALRSAGAPGRVSIADLLALALTIPGIFIAIPALGGVGAAIVSLSAYSLTFALLLVHVRRRFGGTPGDYIVATRRDLADVTLRLRVRARRIRSRGPSDTPDRG